MNGRPHRFGRGPANVLHDPKFLLSGGEQRRREAIRAGVMNRKSFGRKVGGRSSLLHNRDGTLTALGQDVLDARRWKMSYRRIAQRYAIGKTTVWEHCQRFLR